jgi:hypothetical protein
MAEISSSLYRTRGDLTEPPGALPPRAKQGSDACRLADAARQCQMRTERIATRQGLGGKRQSRQRFRHSTGALPCDWPDIAGLSA